jgi:hypothetical protein
MRLLAFRSVACAVAMMAASVSRAEVVFGNLGALGTTPLGTTTTDIGTQDVADINWIAQGFNTGTSSSLTLTAVSLGLFGTDTGTVPLTAAIFSSGTNGKPSTALYTSGTTNVGTAGVYVFSFGNSLLQPNTTYFVLPNGGSWYWNTGSPAAPIGHNGSGYTSAGTWESYAQTLTPTGPWDVGSSTRYSVSVTAGQAVPEPSTYTMVAIGAGAAGLMGWRRRRKVASSAAV